MRWLGGFVCAVSVTTLASSTAIADERGPDLFRLDLGGAYSLRANDARDTFGFGAAFEYERRFHRYLGVGGRLTGIFMPYDQSVYDGAGVATYYSLGADLRAHLTPGADRVDLYVAAGAEGVLTGEFARAGIHGGLGADFRVSGGFGVGPFVQYHHVFQPDGAQRGGTDGRLLFFGVGLTYGNPEGLTEVEPPPPVDTDGDGKFDPDDACPTEPADTADGCPLRDGDADGVVDRDDACPTVPGVAPTGCPTEPAPTDRDGDGVSDANDRCPDVAANSMDGCPAETTSDVPPTDGDRDGDAVRDSRDRCPDEPARTSDGCPAPRVDAGEPPASFSVRLQFGSDSVVLTDEAIAQLAEVRDRLRDDARIRRIRLVGHADRLGDREHNEDLSLSRARHALEWLARNGISRSRLEARGAGMSQPIVDGSTSEELAPNRRVEIFIVDPPVDATP